MCVGGGAVSTGQRLGRASRGPPRPSAAPRAGWIPLSESPSALGSDFRRPDRPEEPRPCTRHFSATSVPPPVQALSSGRGWPPRGSVCVFAEKSHKTSVLPATLYINRPALHRMPSAVPRVASPGPRPAPARPPSTWRHHGPVAAPWPRSAWPTRCPWSTRRDVV